MDALSPHTTLTIPSDCHGSFSGIAFNGCFFYLTAPQESSIYKFERDFRIVDSIKINRPYDCICYDHVKDCFWVAEKKHDDMIFELDCNMKEIGQLRIKTYQKPCSPIIDLSFDCEKDAILAAYKDHIASVSKGSGRANRIRETREGFYTAVLSIAPYYAVVRQDEKGQAFQILTCNGRRIKNIRIPSSYSIKAAMFYPCNERRQDELEFILLATKADCNQTVLLKISVCGLNLSGCNDKVCRGHCREEDASEQCVCRIIESIALVETSLSHILNAEGEKLQKAVEVANSVDELLAINKSVTKTIINIAQLEHELYLKLDALNDLCKKPIHHNEEPK